MAWEIWALGNFDFTAACVTLLLNATTSVLGVLFTAQMWIVRPLSCGQGTSLWNYIMTDSILYLYVMSGMLMMLNVAMTWLEVAKATKVLKKLKSAKDSRRGGLSVPKSALDGKAAVMQRIVMAIFAVLFVLAQVFLGGAYAMGLCVFPAIFFISFFPYGASMLVNLFRKRNDSQQQFIAESTPLALLPSKEQLQYAIAPGKWFQLNEAPHHVSYEARVKQAADLVSILCIRVMVVNLFFVIGAIIYASVAIDYIEYEKTTPAGDVNMTHFALLISFAFVPVAILEVLKYLKVTLKTKLMKRDHGQKKCCDGLFGKNRASRVYDEEHGAGHAKKAHKAGGDDMFAFEVIEPINAVVPPGSCQFGEEWTETILAEIRDAGAVGRVFTFTCPDTTKPLGIPTCACILMKGSGPNAPKGDDNSVTVRPYTPVSTNAMVGKFEIMVKMYNPPGQMSSHLDKLRIGETVDFKHIKFNVKKQYPYGVKNLIMLVAGTGVSPMIQALHAVLGKADDDTKVTLFYGSRRADDILGREILDAWDEQYDQLHLIHTLSQEPADSDWEGERGRVRRDLIEKYGVPPPSAGTDVVFFVCGPPQMYIDLCGARGTPDHVGALADMGYDASQVVKF